MGFVPSEIGGVATGDDIEPEDVTEVVPFVGCLQLLGAIQILAPGSFEVADGSPLGRVAEGVASLEVDLHFADVAFVLVSLVAVDVVAESGDLVELGHGSAVDLDVGEGGG